MRASPLMYNELIFVMVLFFLVASRVFTDKLAINSEFLEKRRTKEKALAGTRASFS